MADHIVKAQVGAVRDLRKSVSRYADGMRDAAAQARMEIGTLSAQAEEVVDLRRALLAAATRDLQRASNALAQCREDCEGLRRTVVMSERRFEEAKRKFDRARKAAQIASQASSDLAKALDANQAVIGQQSSEVSAMLATLDQRLSEIAEGRFWNGVRIATATVGTVVETTAALANAAVNVGNVSQGYIPTAEHPTSIAELQEIVTNDAKQNWTDSDLDERKRKAGKAGKERQ